MNELKREARTINQRQVRLHIWKCGSVFGNRALIHFNPVLRKISTHVYEYLIHAVRFKHTVRTVRILQTIPSKSASIVGMVGTQAPQAHYLSGYTVDFESIAVPKSV